jgi:hypothetical protein
LVDGSVFSGSGRATEITATPCVTGIRGSFCSDTIGTLGVARDAVVTFTAAIIPTPIKQRSASQAVLIIEFPSNAANDISVLAHELPLSILEDGSANHLFRADPMSSSKTAKLFLLLALPPKDALSTSKDIPPAAAICSGTSGHGVTCATIG